MTKPDRIIGVVCKNSAYRIVVSTSLFDKWIMVHIRQQKLDSNEDKWNWTKHGVCLPAEEISTLIEIFDKIDPEDPQPYKDTIYGTVPKRPNEHIVVKRCGRDNKSVQGRDLLHVRTRTYAKDREEWSFTQRGCTLPFEKVKELKNLLHKVQKL